MYRHESLWIATTPPTSYSSLQGNISTEVAILGGGLVGITAALLLKQSGLNVAVVESRRIAEGVSGRTTAKLTSLHRRIYKELLDSFGQERAQQYAQANQTAIEKVASLVRDKGIDCDFVRKPAYTYALTPEHRNKIEQEVDAARSLGLPASFVEHPPLPFATFGAIRFDNQAQFHPRKYLLALASHIPGDGSFLFEQTRALGLEGDGPYNVQTDKGSVVAKHVIVATHFPIVDRGGFYYSRIVPSRSYVLAVRLDQPFPEGMFIGSEQESLSLRSQRVNGGEVVLVTNRAHNTGHFGDTVECYRKLEESARRIYNLRSIEYRWSTQDNITPGHVPYIGKLSDPQARIYVATGFCKWGMTNGTAAAMILSDLVQGRSNPWAPVYDPAHFKPRAAGKTAVDLGLDYVRHYVIDRLPKPKQDVSELKAGEAKLVRAEGKIVAAFKDEQGVIHKVSPSCTHMGCVVTWNNAERSWDCPCHGSRYDYNGEVIQSPAVRNLKKL